MADDHDFAPMRDRFQARQDDGQNACVVDSDGEIVVECFNEIEQLQLLMAQHIAQILNDQDLDHSCSSEGQKWRAKLQLTLINRNGIRDIEAMEFLNVTTQEAGRHILPIDAG